MGLWGLFCLCSDQTERFTVECGPHNGKDSGQPEQDRLSNVY